MAVAHTPTDLFVRLNELGIPTTTLEHAPAFTVEALEAAAGHIPGIHVKNLFLCDAKKKMWLVVAPADMRIDLKKLAGVMGAARLSFGSSDRLARILAVAPGSVTPFAVFNDPEGQVELVLDKSMMQAEVINAHPLVNTMTTSIAPDHLLRFAEACGHKPRLVDLKLAAPD